MINQNFILRDYIIKKMKINKIDITGLIVLSIVSIILHLFSLKFFLQTPDDAYFLIRIIMIGYLITGVFRLIISLAVKYFNLFTFQEFIFIIMFIPVFDCCPYQKGINLGIVFSIAFIIISGLSIYKYWRKLNLENLQ